MQIQGETSVNKLIVLFVFDKMETALSERTLLEMCSSVNNWLHYIDCKELLPRLLEDGFLCHIAGEDDDPLYVITGEGRESLNNFYINIPKSMATIGEEAFKGCSNLIPIIIPESVAVIEAYAFKECDNLTSVTILNGEIRIKLNYSDSPDEIFDECPSFEHIYVPAGTTAHFKEIFGEGLHKFILLLRCD